MTRSVRRLALFVSAASFAVCAVAQDPGVTSLRLEIGESVLSGGESSRGKVGIVRNRDLPAQPVVVKLSTSNAQLVRFGQQEITIPIGQDSAAFEYSTGATPISTSVTITAQVDAPNQPRDTRTLPLVPALIRRVTLSSPSMVGTRGKTIDCTVELKAFAPQGGIELYLGPFYLNPGVNGVKSSSITITNPRVTAGSKTVTFPIRYEEVIDTFSALQMSSQAFNPLLETQTRRVERLVAIDPTLKTAVRDRALLVGFDLVPLRVSSIAVQPASLSGVGEALGTFTLSAVPGNEVVRVGSTRNGTRIVLAGSSCATSSSGTTLSFAEVQIPAGTTSHIFKVCTKPVTTTQTDDISVLMRSGQYKTTFTVNP
jgi:hypothetical protein